MDKIAVTGCDVLDYDTPPRLVEGNAPVYPAENMRAGKEGAATVKFVVHADGSTTIIESTSDQDKYFAGHAALAVRDWKFDPARKGGVAVATRCALKINFDKAE